MLLDPDALVGDFVSLAARRGWALALGDLTHERQLAPHQPHALPRVRCAVYVFSLSAKHGALCPAGLHRVLKVGKAGPRSNARFQSQHYGSRRAPSTLSGRLATTPEAWAYLGVGVQDLGDLGRWIREHTDRDDFYLNVAAEHLLDRLEQFLQARLHPLFEGHQNNLVF